MAKQRVQIRRDTAAAWSAANPTLLAGEVGYETDTRQLKVGTGSTAWNNLPYFAGAIGSLDDLSDVDVSARVADSVLMYDQAAGKFLASSLTTKLTFGDGGNF